MSAPEDLKRIMWLALLELHDRLQERTRRELDYFEAEIECHYNSKGISDLQAEIEIFGRLISDLWRRR